MSNFAYSHGPHFNKIVPLAIGAAVGLTVAAIIFNAGGRTKPSKVEAHAACLITGRVSAEGAPSDLQHFMKNCMLLAGYNVAAECRVPNRTTPHFEDHECYVR
jgi:hypothetical protein